MFLIHSWRTRWRALVLLALMIGLAGGASLAAASGARRSASSLSRFEDEAKVLDVFVAGGEGGEEPQAFLDLLESPLVESHNDLVFVFADDTFALSFAHTSREGLEVEQGVLLQGRPADPDDPNEVVLGEGAARKSGKGIGDVLEVGTITQEQADALLQGTPPTALEGPTLQLEIVGIARNGFDLGNTEDDQALIRLSPAVLEQYDDGEIGLGAPSHMVRLADVPNAVDKFTDGVNEAFGADHLPSINVGQRQETVADALSIITAALVVLAAVVALAGAVWIASIAARQVRLAERDIDVLRALGASRSERRIIVFGIVAPAVLVGVVVAPILAVAMSPRFPVGFARRIDPDLGVHVDVPALAAGVVLIIVIVGLAVGVNAIRVASPSLQAESGELRVPRLIDRLARALRPSPSTGVRFALYAPRRVSAPVRPALVGATVGVIGLVAVAVVGASVQRLIDAPERWGTPWDVTVGGGDDNSQPLDSEAIDRDALLADDDVQAASVVLYDEQVAINGVEAISMTVEQVKGEVSPTIVEGRAPRAADEVALARDTINAVDASIGDTVKIASRSQLSGEYTIVGVVAFPSISTPAPLATGASFTPAGGDRLGLGVPNEDGDYGNYFIAIRWAPGVDDEAGLKRLGYAERQHLGPITPPEIRGLRDVERFPLIAGVALAVLGSIATTHALLVTVRRRRLELGVLSAHGFVPRQRREAINAQATTVALVALAVGVPVGAIFGRQMWLAIARSIGVGDDARFPVLLLAAGAVALVVVLNLIAAWPAHRARRLRVAEALRSE